MTTLKKILVAVAFIQCALFAYSGDAIKSIDTSETIMKIRTANVWGRDYILATSYDGQMLLFNGSAKLIWKKPLSGLVNNDICINDIDLDGSPELICANADGSIYCLNTKAEIKWTFKQNDAPMNAVCVIKKGEKKYLVCGGYDTNLYYLDSNGKLVKTISSKLYNREKTWGARNGVKPKSDVQSINFIKETVDENGEPAILVNGVVNSMAGSGGFYFFKPFEETPYKYIKIKDNIPIGDIALSPYVKGVGENILAGGSGMFSKLTYIDVKSGNSNVMDLINLSNRQVGGFGYRVAQGRFVDTIKGYDYFVLYGNNIQLIPSNPSKNNVKTLTNKYSYNNLAHDLKNNKMILSSAQSGGSCIHIIDLDNPNWQKEYEALEPKGKISKILENTKEVVKDLAKFEKPKYQKEQLPVYFLSDYSSKRKSASSRYAEDIMSKYSSPIFLNSTFLGTAQNWDRSGFGNKFYETRRDVRRKYNMTQQDYLNAILPLYQGESKGVSYWGGHGNDPIMFPLVSQKKIVDGSQGKKTVMIFPELEASDDNFTYVVDNYFYPLAEYMQGKNSQLYIRSKHTFWLGTIHMPVWKRLISGEFADIFIPAMEETTDKSMELSIAGRLGVWASGSVDSWGDRCARDNQSYDRLRQFGHQNLPNHFLRSMIYRISYGSQYLDNFAVDQDYMSVLWYLIAKGALYVPQRNEIVSFSPVHLSMLDPDDEYIHNSNDVKWTNQYDGDYEEKNPMVFSRLNGSWAGAKNTDWDFSRYAAGVNDRRLNFLPPYENGMVMITPVNQPTKWRKSLEENLNPIYKGIMKEYFTDGRNYYKTAEKKNPISAKDYYKEIEKDIQESAKKLPLTVKGEQVAWVAAQPAENHLRVTIIDGGYINPDDREATLIFNTIQPKKVTDILSGKSFEIKKGKCIVDIACGMFRFLDVEF